MTIDHIGYAVKRIDQAISAFEILGFIFGSIIDDTDRNVRIAFGEKDGYRIELISPLNKDEVSPVDAYLGKIGSTPYHFCYQSNDFEADIENLKQEKFIIISAPKPAIAFNGKRVVFMMNRGLGLLEIVES